MLLQFCIILTDLAGILPVEGFADFYPYKNWYGI